MDLHEIMLKKLAEVDMGLVVNGFFTLAGAILGSVITIFSQRGKLHISMSGTKLSFSQDKGLPVPDGEGGNYYVNPKGDTISIDCRIDIINSSMNTASLRNLGIEFRRRFKKAWVHNLGTEINIISNSQETLKAINIHPKELKSYHIFTGGISGIDKTEMLKFNCINLIYLNEKGRLKRTNVYTGDISKLVEKDTHNQS